MGHNWNELLETLERQSVLFAIYGSLTGLFILVLIALVWLSSQQRRIERLESTLPPSDKAKKLPTPITPDVPNRVFTSLAGSLR